MSDEPKFTENSAKLLASIELESALSKQRREDMKAAGASEDEILEAWHNDAGGFRWMIKGSDVTRLLTQMGTAFGMGQSMQDQSQGETPKPWREWKNKAFVPYAAGVRALVDSPEYKRWDAMFSYAKTLRDVWIFFLQENLIGTEQVGEALPEIDWGFFLDHLDTLIDANDGSSVFVVTPERLAQEKERVAAKRRAVMRPDLPPVDKYVIGMVYDRMVDLTVEIDDSLNPTSLSGSAPLDMRQKWAAQYLIQLDEAIKEIEAYLATTDEPAYRKDLSNYVMRLFRRKQRLLDFQKDHPTS